MVHASSIVCMSRCVRLCMCVSVQELLAHRSNLIGCCDVNGQTALHIAATEKCRECLSIVLKVGGEAHEEDFPREWDRHVTIDSVNKMKRKESYTAFGNKTTPKQTCYNS